MPWFGLFMSLVLVLFISWLCQLVLAKIQKRRQAIATTQQFTGFQLGYRQAFEDIQSWQASRQLMTVSTEWTEENFLDRLASEYFQNGNVPPARDWRLI